jgi:hypothetical protein
MYSENKYQAKLARLLTLRVLKRLTNNLWQGIDLEEYNRLNERNALLEGREAGVPTQDQGGQNT